MFSGQNAGKSGQNGRVEISWMRMTAGPGKKAKAYTALAKVEVEVKTHAGRAVLSVMQTAQRFAELTANFD